LRALHAHVRLRDAANLIRDGRVEIIDEFTAPGPPKRSLPHVSVEGRV
jgi:hypothetical protein